VEFFRQAFRTRMAVTATLPCAKIQSSGRFLTPGAEMKTSNAAHKGFVDRRGFV
jgi:hypothetical protein